MTGEGFPRFEELHVALKEKGVVVLAVNGKDTPESAAGYVKENGFTFPFLARPNRDRLPERIYKETGSGSGIVLVDRDGKIVWAETPGAVSISNLVKTAREKIEKLLTK